MREGNREEKLKLKWWYFFIILLVYHVLIPVKYFIPYGCCLHAWGIVGMYETFRSYPFSFLLNPLLMFLVLKLSLYIYYKIKD